MRNLAYPVCLAGILSCAATLALAQTAASAPPTASLVLTPGDLVRVNVWRRPELSGEFLVAADSSLKHPLYQEVKVGGLSVAVAKERLRTFLLRFQQVPQLSLEPLLQVTVGGEVQQPNLYRLPPETDVAQAVALAGGPTERGRLDQVRLVRGNRESLLDLTRPVAAALQTPVASGDRIFVGRRDNTNFLRDVLAPLASVVAALGSVAILIFGR